MSLFNELAQWAVLVFVLLLVVGLLRQLGAFLAGSQAGPDVGGPPLGERLPAQAFEASTLERVRGLAAGSETGELALLVMEHDCEPCERLLSRLRHLGGPPRVPTVAVIANGHHDGGAGADGIFDLIVDDRARHVASALSISATPFLLVLDRDLTVTQKDSGADLAVTVPEWLGRTQDGGETAAERDAAARGQETR